MKTSLFTGVNNAVRGLQHAQHAVTVHGTNIAHANDPAYTRRQVLAPTEGGMTGPGIARIRDLFIDEQFRYASGSLGNAEVRQDVLSKVEDIIGDPVNGGLRKALDQFFDAWQALADEPTSGVARLQVLQAGRLFVNEIQTAYRAFSSLQETVNLDLEDRSREVNQLLEQVFSLNKRISYLSRNNMNDADLRDQRDLALDRLAKLVGATATEGKDGVVRISVGSVVVLDGPTVMKLKITESGTPVWESGDGFQQVFTGGGAVAGLVSVRDGELSVMKAEIARLAQQVASAVNGIYGASAKDGEGQPVPFFVNASNPQMLAVNPAITAEGLVAGTQGPSDGSVARQIAELATVGIAGWTGSTVVSQGKMTPGAFYQNLVGWLGTRASDANLAYDVAKAHVEVSEEHRQSSWGVSLDEEVASLSMQQKAFAACSHVITIMDAMLQDLLNAIR